MTQLGQAQVGHKGSAALRSTPKLTRINGDDNLKVIWKNMGNNHAYPFIWAERFSADAAETFTVVSGVKLHGMPAAEYCMVTVGGTENTVPFVTKDVDNNIITVDIVASGTVDVMVMVGYPSPNIEAIACRGNTGARQMLP
jgi:hypothetical protein